MSHLARPLIDTWYIDFRCELDGGRSIWIAVSAMDVDTVNAILMDALISLRQYDQSRGSEPFCATDLGIVHGEGRVSCRSNWTS